MRLSLLLFFIIHTLLNAEDSKLEIGVGIGSMYYPDYIGSKSSSVVTLPFPYVKYTSEYFNIDKDGINRELFNIKDLTLDLSVSGSLPANADDNKAREGMDDLNFTFEVGPKLNYILYTKKSFEISLDVAIRAAFETDLSMVKAQGLRGTTDLRFDIEYQKLDITFRTGLRFSDAKYNNYFYGVDKEFETPLRATYDASSGYSGFKNRLGCTYRDGDWWYGALISYYLLDGASYEDSPLVETNHALFGGVSLAYIFYTD